MRGARAIPGSWPSCAARRPGRSRYHCPSFATASTDATLVRDGQDDSTVRVENTSGKQGDTLSLDLRAGGGFIGRFSRP